MRGFQRVSGARSTPSQPATRRCKRDEPRDRADCPKRRDRTKPRKPPGCFAGQPGRVSCAFVRCHAHPPRARPDRAWPQQRRLAHAARSPPRATTETDETRRCECRLFRLRRCTDYGAVVADHDHVAVRAARGDHRRPYTAVACRPECCLPVVSLVWSWKQNTDWTFITRSSSRE